VTEVQQGKLALALKIKWQASLHFHHSQAGTWNAFYGEHRIAEFRRRIYLEAFGEDYPEEVATDG
jgi:hypothetical protein